MTSLDLWVTQATCHLSRDSAAQVRREISEHYEQEHEAAVARGSSAEEADRSAVASLGSPKAANRQYRKVLLTTEEARMLRAGNWEARAICSRSWLKWTILSGPLALSLVMAALFSVGKTSAAWDLLLIAIAMGLFFVAPFFPIYTPTRSRIYRAVKWAAVLVLVGFAFGRETLQYSWLLTTCAWIPVWTEWTRFSLRRKLPVSDWPRQLYL